LGRWCKDFKKERVTLMPIPCHHAPYIDIGARGPILRVYAHIYTAIRRTANHPYTRVSDPGSPRITGSQGHGVTRATEPQRATESRRRKVTGSPNIQVSKYPRIMGSQGHPSHIIIWSLGHWVTGSMGITGLSITRVYLSMAQVSRVSMVTGLPRFLDHMIIG
jgi:hypothetical protein